MNSFTDNWDEILWRMKRDNYKYDYEISAWLRTLDYLQQESIYMKHYIAEIMKQYVNAELLDKIESYQNMLLNKETVIAFLRMDIRKMKQDYFSGIDVTQKHKGLRLDMTKMEKEYSLIKSEFNNYLQNIL